MSCGVSTPPIWHMILAPMPDVSQALIARSSGSTPCCAFTFSDMRTLIPNAMSAFSVTVRAAGSICARS